MRTIPGHFAWGGLNTKASTTGLPLLECVHLQDMRVVGRDIVERLGIDRVAQFAGNYSGYNFVAADSEAYYSIAADTRVWTLGLRWTLEMLIEPDTTSGTMGLLTVGHSTQTLVLDITGGDIRCRFWDSGATLTTVTVGAAATSVQSIQVTRDGATLSTRLNNGTAVTGSVSATLLGRAPSGQLRIGLDTTTNFYDGTIDYVRLYDYVKDDHNDRLIREPDPRSRHVMADYGELSGTGIYYDRSRYANHLLVTANSPDAVTSLCHNPAPIRALSMSVDENGRKQLLIMAGGSYYLATVA